MFLLSQAKILSKLLLFNIEFEETPQLIFTPADKRQKKLA